MISAHDPALRAWPLTNAGRNLYTCFQTNAARISGKPGSTPELRAGWGRTMEKLYETERLILRCFTDGEAQAMYDSHLDNEART